MSVFFTGQALQNAGTGTIKRRINLKPIFNMHVVIMYSGHCRQQQQTNKTKKLNSQTNTKKTWSTDEYSPTKNI